MTQDFWTAPGRWFKGNLHTHTSCSDGSLGVAETIAQYRQAGYDFLAITDHDRLTRTEPYGDRDFLLLPGEEISLPGPPLGGWYHLVAINLREEIKPADFASPAEVIAAVRAQGGEVICAHPAWTGLTFAELLPMADVLGLEIFNSSCHYSIGRGHSLNQWDDLLRRGRRWFGFASDDCHNHSGPLRPNDAAVAGIWVKAAQLTAPAVLAAIRAGHFYASWGPRLEQFGLRDGVVSVRCTPARIINLHADPGIGLGESFTAAAGAELTGASYRLRGAERYLRAEVIDAQGRSAWSNPLFIG